MKQKTKDCPQCGKKAVYMYSGATQLSDPPAHIMMWYCACGYIENAGVEREESEDSKRKRLWKEAQDE